MVTPKVRTTLYSMINSTTGKYCSVAFSWVVTYTIGFHPQTQKLKPLYLQDSIIHSGSEKLIVSWKATFKCRSKHGHSQATNYCDSDLAFARITWEMPLNLGRKTPRENWRKSISGRQFSFSETWWTVQCPYARNLPSSSSDARIPCPRETSEKSNIYTRRHARKINFMF